MEERKKWVVEKIIKRKRKRKVVVGVFIILKNKKKLG
jgi:hypothetical protein